MIRKLGKARWTYECQPCNEHAEAVDQFRAIEYGQWHEKTYGHASTALAAAFTKVANELADLVRPVVDAFAAWATPPPNIPRDPSQRRDRRKWGGR